jgi:hypothetical protein
VNRIAAYFLCLGLPTIEFAAHPVGRIAAYFLYTGLRIKMPSVRQRWQAAFLCPGDIPFIGFPLFILKTHFFKS